MQLKVIRRVKNAQKVTPRNEINILSVCEYKIPQRLDIDKLVQKCKENACMQENIVEFLKNCLE